MLNKIIYKLGLKKRNPSICHQLNFLKKSDKWPLSRLQKYQLSQLQIFLTDVQKNSPYYSDLFKSLGFDPRNIKSLNDLKCIPPIDKKTLIANKHLIQSNRRFKKLVFSETSGTTGQPLTIYRSEEWDSGTRAAMFRGYSWYGVKPWDRNGYFWGYNIEKKQAAKIQFFDSLQNRFRLFSYTDEEISRFCYKLKSAVYISGYSSMIYEVAKKINSLGLSLQFPKLKMVKGTSEKIWPSYQKEVQKAFGLKMISEYGSMETGIIAFECPSGNMHIAMEHVIVEELNGEAVVTNLLSNSFPIIRYKLGDVINLAPIDFKCPCGRSHPVIVDVLGRVGKSVEGLENKYPSLTFYYVFKNIAFTSKFEVNYQAVQNKKGEVLMRIEQTYSKELDSIIRKELSKYFKDDIAFTVEYDSKLHMMDGKLKDFIQNIE
ncbi:phenylacetate--CoA ligase family protein [Bacteroides coprosuis]|uniref:phenylacetate--CoA ligase family protein n=1 Tax=Bacteroides coprosuis TaxID=151276 RepID=UPI001DC419B1|nr:hypothetical protein [Bacteroides coprosuis]HJD92275.1 hypothetical protein [Bacteroides coprosuis]